MARGEFDQNRPSSEGEPASLIVTRYGLPVLRQLTPEEMGVKPTEVIPTPESFKIHGVNETPLIRSLRSLNGTPISTLETRMRPAGAAYMGLPGESGGISGGGFLGRNESLPQVLGDDNDTVLGMGLNHQQLASFLFYFDDVEKVRRQTEERPMAFDYNGRTFIHSKDAYRGMQDSPFADGTNTNTDETITCLEDGSSISYSGLLPFMIHRYGFYEGKSVGYRLDPTKLAEVAGFIPRPDNDPVATLVKDLNAEVEIKTADELNRLRNINGLMNLLSAPNLKIVPGDLDTLLKVIDNFGVASYQRSVQPDSEARVARRQNIADKVVTDEIAPAPYIVEGYSDILLTKVLHDFPQLQPAVLQGIEGIDFAQKPDGSTDEFGIQHFLQQIMVKMGKKDETGKLLPTAEYAAGLLQKVDRTADNVLRIYEAAAKSVEPVTRTIGKKSEVDETEIQTLAQTLDTALPTFTGDVISLYRQMGMPVQEGMALADLIKSKNQMDNYKKVVTSAIDFAQRVGGLKSVRVADMGILLGTLARVKADPEHEFTSQELAAMKRLKVEPELVPYAIKAPGAQMLNETTVAQLYNGVAASERTRERILAQLPSSMNQEARAAVEFFIKEVERSSFGQKLDINQLIAGLNAKAADLNQQTGEDVKKELDQEDVLGEYFGLAFPPFKDLLTSPYVSVRINPRDFLNQLNVTLDQEALKEIPEQKSKDPIYSFMSNRTVVINGQEYVIDNYKIQSGEFKLDLRDGKVSLHMTKNRPF